MLDVNLQFLVKEIRITKIWQRLGDHWKGLELVDEGRTSLSLSLTTKNCGRNGVEGLLVPSWRIGKVKVGSLDLRVQQRTS